MHNIDKTETHSRKNSTGGQKIHWVSLRLEQGLVARSQTITKLMKAWKVNIALENKEANIERDVFLFTVKAP